jgi:hypothetical protein
LLVVSPPTDDASKSALDATSAPTIADPAVMKNSANMAPTNTASLPCRIVAAQVEFERHILKPVFHLIGVRVETRGLSAVGSYGSGGVNVHRSPHRMASSIARKNVLSPTSVMNTAT